MAGRSELDKALSLTTPEAFVEWMIVGHGLSENSRSTIVSNLKDAFQNECRTSTTFIFFGST